MSIAEFSIKNKVLSVIVILLCLIGGLDAYQNMARFEDPEFTIRQAVVITQYPGASPEEVAREVSEPLETVLQQLQEVKTIKTTSRAGVSEINVEIKYTFSKNKNALQGVWTKMRNKISDARGQLPQDASTPYVNDDFGDLYGFSFYITGEDYSPADLETYARALQKEILQVEGVGKIQLGGAQKEAIFVEMSRSQLSTLGRSVSSLYDILSQQNAVVAAGNVSIGDQRLIIDPTGAIDTVNSIKNLLVSSSSDGKIVYLGDIANVYRGYQSPATHLIRYDGKPAISLGVSAVTGGNVVVIGKAVNQKIEDAVSRRPIGMDVSKYYHQGEIVEKSVSDFVVNVIAALVIVIVTLFVFMGMRSAVVIGFILILTIAATLLTMNLMSIPMHRISLGALIIALGMMVDNAIVVTEGILVGIQRGVKKLQIAKDIVTQTKWPLLGGTLVGIIAFAPIGFAPGSTAEYTGDLFWVILISLLFSWIFAITITPLCCHWIFTEAGDATEEQEDGKFAKTYKKLMRMALNKRWLMLVSATGLFALSIWGAQFMAQGFFPRSTTPQLVVDYWLPEGTNIERTARDMKEIEDYLMTLDNINAIQAQIGKGGTRFMLTYSGQSSNTSYGQFLLRVDDYTQLDSMMPGIQHFIKTNYPEAAAKVWRFVLGPGGGSAIEAEFRGQDPKILRSLADQATDIMRADRSLSVKNDWRSPVSVIEPLYSEGKARRAGVSRTDLASALQAHYAGKQVGVYRENDKLIPIISRSPGTATASITDIRSIQVLSSGTGKMIPIEQVTSGFRTVWRDGQLISENRTFLIKAQSDPYPDELASTLLSRIRPAIEAIELPDGYTLKWGGQEGDSAQSNGDLMSTIPMGLLAMVLVVVILFGKIKQPLVIWIVVPGLFIGVVLGLVLTNVPLEFMGILGILSLSGLLIKNAIVLVDQMDFEINTGKPRYDAVVDAATSRVRPVMMGTLTTVLGVIPLYFDAFFQSMAVVIIFGLSFATLLTLLIVPVLYSVFMNVQSKETAL